MAFTAASIGELGDLAQRHGSESTTEVRSSSKGGRAMYGGSLVMLDCVQNVVGSTGRFFFIVCYFRLSLLFSSEATFIYKYPSLCLDGFCENAFSRPQIKIKV